jgi:predicted phage tail protein
MSDANVPPWVVPDPRKGIWKARARKAAGVTAAVLGNVVRSARVRTRASAEHIRDHVYTIFGFTCIDAAFFTHSLFSGLLATGISWFLFEWKVSDSDG